MISYCTRCGEGLDAAVRFCVRCGSEQTAVAPLPMPPQATPSLLGGPYPAGFRTMRLAFDGKAFELFLIYLRTVLLSIVTLGIYSFWARAEIRRYLADRTRFDGVAFAFKGTGTELALGFLRALGLLLTIVAALVLSAVLIDDKAGAIVGFVLFYGGLLALAPLVLVGAWRYRMSRTSLRGIRFAFHGKVGECARIILLGGLLSFLFFGLYTPFFLNNLRRFYVRNSAWGSARFDYDGEGSELFGAYLGSALLTVPTLGLSLLWFRMRKHNYYWEHTTFQGARFRSTVSFGEYAFLQITNVLAVVFTLGLAWPWAKVRSLRFTLERLTVDGVLSLEQIAQQITDASATGDVVSGLLDFGASDLGLGM